MNAIVAQSLGLKEGSLIKCSLVVDVMNLTSVSATVTTQKDWELLEMSANRIQSTLLNQTKIINQSQNLVVWINPSIYINLKIKQLTPNVSFGKLENNTEIIIAPFNKKIETEENIKPSYKPAAMNANYKLSHCQSEMFPFRKNTTKGNDDKHSSLIKELDEMTKILKKEAPQSFEFRIIPIKWEKGQITDLYVDRTNALVNFPFNQVFVLNTNNNQEYYVNIKTLNQDKPFPKTCKYFILLFQII